MYFYAAGLKINLFFANNYYLVISLRLFSLARRVDRMETAIIPLGYNLDKVLEKLNNVNKDRKIKRKDMENIFDDIVKGEDGMHVLLKT